MKKLSAIGFSALVAALPVASSAEDLSFDLGPADPDPGREWTIMVYLDGDNDLETFALRDLNEMEAGLPDEAVEVVVLIDRASDYDDSDGDWTDARIYRVRHDDNPDLIASEELARAGEVNMGAPETLSAFLAASIDRFPARRYGLVLWDHGGGWRLMALDHDAPGATDGTDSLDIAEVGHGLRAGLARAGVAKLDIVGFDMCLMAQLETAYELRGLADVLVASQATEPGDGWPYTEILPTFARGTLGPRRLGAAIVDAYGTFYDDRDESVATLSAIDLTQVDRITGALDRLLTGLDGKIPASWSDMSRSVFYAESYAARSSLRRKDEALSSVDLLDMLKRMHNAIADFPAEAAYRDVIEAMDFAVIANYHSRRHRLSNGVAIYSPVTRALMNEAYARTAFAAQTGWPDFLKNLYQTQAQNLSQPNVTNLRLIDSQTGAQVSGGPPGGGFKVEAAVVGRNVLWVEALEALWDEENQGHLVLSKSYIFDTEYYKRRLEAVADVIDLLMPEFRGDSNVVSQEFQGRRFYVSNGETAVLATIDTSDLSDLTTASTPIQFARGDEEFFATVYFDLYAWNAYSVVVEIPQDDGGVAYRRVEPEPDDKATILFEFIPADDGDLSYLKGETLNWGNGLELIIGDDDPGEIVIAVRAESIGGMSSFASTPISVEQTDTREQGFIDAAKALTPDELLGTWRWNGLVDGRWQPIPLTTEFKRWEKDPSILVATLRSDDDPSFPQTPSEAILDTRLTPTLRMISYDDEGVPAEMEAYSLKVVRQPNQPPLIQLKQLGGKGWLIVWTREGEAPQAPTPQQSVPQQTMPEAPAPQPPAVPQTSPVPPQEIVSLAGLWAGPEEMYLAMDDTNYELYMSDELVDMGSYQIVGNRLVTNDYFGDQDEYVFEATANSFAITDREGTRLVFRRVQ